MTEPASTLPSPDPAKPAWYKRKWIQMVAVGFVCIGIGAAGASTDPTTTDAYKALSSKYESAQSDLTEALEQIGDLPEREKALDDKTAAQAADQKQLEQDQTDLKSETAAVLKREKKVGIAEKDIADNTIAGDGTYEVGVDMKAGKYKSKNEGQCYWSVNADANGSNILNNGLSSGPQTVTVSNGQYFETGRCGDWVRQ